MVQWGVASALSLALASALALAVPASAHAQGGPDAFGYAWGFGTDPFVPLSGMGTSWQLNPSSPTAMGLPFAFPWYGNFAGGAFVHASGSISLNGGPPVYGFHQPFPSPSGPDIAVF